MDNKQVKSSRVKLPRTLAGAGFELVIISCFFEVPRYACLEEGG